ncbi:collagen alpha-1(I) chain-like [Molothrus ater]|uniref:collagen alpha-1(I) chain-like n=1 Tax=Molothrus ater TaxID=84834 RepID=UPI00174CCD44|nr:collagen alpha-1(I) chain-like [Molothrus ater]
MTQPEAADNSDPLVNFRSRPRQQVYPAGVEIALSRKPKARPRRAHACAETAAFCLSPPPTDRPTATRERASRRRGERRRAPSRRRQPKRERGRDGPAWEDGLGEGEREGSDGALRARPETATEGGGGGAGEGRGRGRNPPPVPGALASRARQHGTVPPRYPLADSRPRGGEAGGEARASPPLLAPSSLFLSRPSAAPFDAVSRSPRGRRAAASAARPRRGRAPPQRLAPGAGSYGALPESAFRGTKALRGGDDDDDRGDARRAAGKGSRPAEGNASLAEPLTAFPPGTGGTPPPPPLAADNCAEDARARAWLRPYEHTENGKGKKNQTHSPKAGQEAGEPAHPTASPPRGETPTSPTPSFGGGPRARARPGLRAEGRAARAGTRGGTAARPLLAFTGRRARHTRHAAGARGRQPPRRAGSPLGPDAAAPRGRLVSLPPTARAFPPGSRRARDDDRPPAGTPPAGPLPRRASERATGGRAPPPAPEAGATETRAGVASARGLPDGRTGRRRGRTPGTAAATSHRRGPLPRARARRKALRALSRGATPALLVRTRRPGGEERPRGRPARLPAAHTRPRQGRRRRRRAGPGTGPPPADGVRRPADRPRRGGTPVERRRRRSPRGRPRSRASAAGGPAERSPPTGGRAVEPGDGRRTDGATAARSRRKGRRGGGEAPDAPDAAPPRAPETAAAGPGVRARAGPGGRHPAAEEGAESARSLPASPVTTRRAGRPPRPTARRGLSAEAGPRRGGAGRPSPARRG